MMSEKRFVACDKWADSEGNIFKFVVIDMKKLGDKQFVLRCNHWSEAQDICNKLNDTLDELREENEQLKFENKTLKSNYQREIQSSMDFCNAYSKTNGELLEEIEKLKK